MAARSTRRVSRPKLLAPGLKGQIGESINSAHDWRRMLSSSADDAVKPYLMAEKLIPTGAKISHSVTKNANKYISNIHMTRSNYSAAKAMDRKNLSVFNRQLAIAGTEAREKSSGVSRRRTGMKGLRMDLTNSMGLKSGLGV